MIPRNVPYLRQRCPTKLVAEANVWPWRCIVVSFSLLDCDCREHYPLYEQVYCSNRNLAYVTTKRLTK